jgi:hypothetical protein
MLSGGGGTTVAGGVEHTRQALVDFKTVNCPGSYMWLFDGPNLTGDELCLHGPAAWDLSQFGLPATPPSINWAGKVHSFWAGDEIGVFAEHDCDNQSATGATVPFGRYQRNDSYFGISNWVIEEYKCL